MQTRHLLDLVHRAADAAPAAADAVLLGRFAEHRDHVAFEALVRRHGPMVWAVCRQSLHNPSDAEDAFQATFLALVRSARRVRGSVALPAWLHRVAVRAAVRVRRGAARRQVRERAAATTEADRPVPDAAWAAALAAVHEEVARLPEGERVAFVLCDLEGVRQPDAAARLGWKPGTLTGRLARARRTLLDRLTRRGVSPAALGVAAAVADGVPVGAAQRVLDWAGGVPAPAGILKLVSEILPVTNRIKLWVAAGTVACGVVLAGVGTTRPPTVEADDYPVPTSPPAGRAAPGLGGLGTGTVAAPVPGTAAPAGRATWEYTYADVPNSPAEFEDLLALQARNGWEYAGVVDPVLFAQGNRPGKARIVFKRPKVPAAAVAAAPTVAAPAVPTPPVPPAVPGTNADRDVAVRLAEFALQRADSQLVAAKTAFEVVSRDVKQGIRPQSEFNQARLKVATAELDVAEATVRLDATRIEATKRAAASPVIR